MKLRNYRYLVCVHGGRFGRDPRYVVACNPDGEVPLVWTCGNVEAHGFPASRLAEVLTTIEEELGAHLSRIFVEPIPDVGENTGGAAWEAFERRVLTGEVE